MGVVLGGCGARRLVRRSASTARDGQASAAPLQRAGQSRKHPQFILHGYLGENTLLLQPGEQTEQAVGFHRLYKMMVESCFACV